MKNGPVVQYNSNRLIGIELEFDAGNMSFNLPSPMPDGWHAINDGSLRNGKEIVMTHPVQFSELFPVVQRLSRGLIMAKTGINRRGGFHVHVGGEGWVPESAYRVAMIYTHFQRVINKLVGESRVDNRFASSFSQTMSEHEYYGMFSLHSPATTRAQAKSTRAYRVVNPASVRCIDPAIRSVEFRQGSPSKHTVNIMGWTAFLVVLSDIAIENGSIYASLSESEKSIEGLSRFVELQEIANGGSNVSAWIEWRYNYMNELPKNWESEMTKLCSVISSRNRGIVGISQAMNMPYPQVVKLLKKGIELGCVCEDGGKYHSNYNENQAQADLNAMVAFDANPVDVSVIVD